MSKVARVLAVLGALALVAAACGSESSSSSASGGGESSAGPEVISTIGAPEGELNLVAWPYYTEKDWVKPFEQETGCQVNVKYGNTSDEMVNLMRQGGGTLYDGVSASGDASNRLIANGDVAAVDVNMFQNYSDVMPSLQAPAHNTVDGVHYGVPYTWGPNVLLWNTDAVTTAPTSWNVVFESQIDGQDNPYAGKITAYDSPIYIADAAMYLMAHNPDLGITDPYELTTDQLNAAVDLLKAQSGMVKKYWALYTDEVDGFNAGDMNIGTAWPVNQSLIAAEGTPVESTIPEEGATGWADTWMMSANAQHPNCMLLWMDYTLRPEVQAAVAYTFGATPATLSSCPILNKDLGKDAALYHCGDDAYLQSIYLWKTPLTDCGDGRTDCADYNVWTQKWLEIRA
jgi:putative spermidine/putrescine transport system substrate-binding protein